MSVSSIQVSYTCKYCGGLLSTHYGTDGFYIACLGCGRRAY